MKIDLLKDKIASVKQKIYFFIILQGLSKSGIILLSLCFSTFILDYFLHLPLLMRILLLIVSLVILIFYLAQNLIIPFRTDICDDDIVLAVEKVYPFLKERLISALQFSRLINEPDYKDSKFITMKVIEESQQLAAKINFSKILNIKGTILRILSFILLFASILYCFILFPNLSKLTNIWFSRNVILQTVSWPRKTYLFLLKEKFLIQKNKEVRIILKSKKSYSHVKLWYINNKPGIKFWKQKKLVQNHKDKGFIALLKPTKNSIYFYFEIDNLFSGMYKIIPSDETIKNKSIAINFPDYSIVKSRGENLFITVVTRGKEPHKIELESFFEDEEINGTTLMNQGQGFFKYEFRTLTQNFSFIFNGGDDIDNIPRYRVKVLTPPAVDEIAVWYYPLKYTNIKNTPINAPENSGDLKGLKGTRVLIRLRVNKRVQQAKIVFPGKYESVLEPVLLKNSPPTPEFPESELYMYGELTIKYDTNYKINLIGKDGLSNENKASFFINALDDQGPYIKIESPLKKYLKMVKNGHFELRTKVKDDFGITKISLLYKVNDSKLINVPFNETHNNKKYPAKDIESKYFFDLSKIVQVKHLKKKSLENGDIVSLKIEARDNNNFSGINTKESYVLKISILDKTKLANLLNDNLKEIKRELKRIYEQQAQIKDVLKDFIHVKGSFESGDISKLLQLRYSQLSISRDTSKQGEEVQQVIRTIENNNLWDFFPHENLNKIDSTLQLISYKSKNQNYEGVSTQIEKLLIGSYHIIRKSDSQGISKIKEAIEKQNFLLSLLDKVIALLNEWEDFTEVIKGIDNILDAQKKMEPQLKKMLDKNK